MFTVDDHPSFVDHPSPSDQVWRYMDIARYLSLLQSRALHFARADQMADKWEGAYGTVNQATRPQIYGENYELMWANPAERRRTNRQLIHMNCWHANEFESAAMWEIYQREGRGVAIQSTWADLTASITSDRVIYGGHVTYADYTKTFIPEGNMFDAFMHKRESYAHEREVRLITLTGLAGPNPNEPGTMVSLGPEAAVLPVEINLERLVRAVYVAPEAPEWVATAIEDLTRTYGFGFDVKQSDLSRDPVA